MSLKEYDKKRNFKKSSEPKGIVSHQYHHLFVIQKHAASHLHYDFRLELNGVLLSWAVPKGPCYDPTVKRLAVHVEDHPVAYGFFEGIIPKGEYGGGTVMLWDRGVWNPLDEDPEKAYKKGHLRFELVAEKLKGRWDLVRFKEDKNWFLIKYRDEFAQPLTDYDVILAMPDSVASKKSMDEITKHHDFEWTTQGASPSKKKIRISKLKLPVPLPTASFPDFYPPQLATLMNKAPTGDEWLHEIKLDGYRILSFINGDEIILKSRTNKDWTIQFSPIADSLKDLALPKAIFDGEVVLLNKEGKSDFQLLQNSLNQNDLPFIYYIFDFLYYDKYDLQSLPLLERKSLLHTLLNDQKGTLRYSDHIISNGPEIFKNACELGLEGIISKRIDSTYSSQRNKSWLKIKCVSRQEFIICGYTPPQGGRDYFGALLLGVYNSEGQLEYAGNVGTGFTQASLFEVFNKIQKHRISKSPFATKIPASSKISWVDPVLVAEVEFTQWTTEGHLRHPSFKGLRLDKPAKNVKREEELSISRISKTHKIKDKKMAAAKKSRSSFKITHPEKIIYPEDGLTKQDLLIYYEAVADWMLPYVKDRPLSLVRCPDDYTKCFFQRHYTKSVPSALKPVSIEMKEGKETYIYLDDKEGLLSLVQMGVLEIHPWGCLITDIEKPDFIVIDLDPAPELEWKDVVAGAREVKHHLKQYELTSFVKTTGGKGLHVVVPIKPEYTWDEVKNFTHVFVGFLEQLHPDKYVSNMAKKKRTGKIFIDYLRNQRGATAIGVYSSRARPHAPVSAPIDWDELSDNKEDTEFNILTLPDRLKRLKKDPWEDYWQVTQSLHLDKL